jgi:hypothetical protein
MKYTAKNAAVQEDRTIGTSNINIPKQIEGTWNVECDA